MDLGPRSPAICLLYPPLAACSDAICCSMCAVGRRDVEGREAVLDCARREQPQIRVGLEPAPSASSCPEGFFPGGMGSDFRQDTDEAQKSPTQGGFDLSTDEGVF